MHAIDSLPFSPMVCPSHPSFLSHVQIRIVENLEGLHELRVLTLSHNQIVSLAGLAADRFQVQRGARLTRLDVRHNLLGAFASADAGTSGTTTAGRNRAGTARRAHGAGALANGSDRGEDGHDEDDEGIVAARNVFDALSACTALRELALHGNDRLLHTLSSASVGLVASYAGDSGADEHDIDEEAAEADDDDPETRRVARTVAKVRIFVFSPAGVNSFRYF
jgi:hypothetical protein